MPQILFQVVVDDTAGALLVILDETRITCSNAAERQKKAYAIIEKLRISRRVPIPTRIRALGTDGTEIGSWQLPDRAGGNEGSLEQLAMPVLIDGCAPGRKEAVSAPLVNEHLTWDA